VQGEQAWSLVGVESAWPERFRGRPRGVRVHAQVTVGNGGLPFGDSCCARAGSERACRYTSTNGAKGQEEAAGPSCGRCGPGRERHAGGIRVWSAPESAPRS